MAEPHPWPQQLPATRRIVLAQADLDDTRLMPAWQRYDGAFYRAAGAGLEEAAQAGRLLILSGGYGLLEGTEPIGTYDRVMNLRDWPGNLLEDLLEDRSRGSGLDVVAFAATSTGYAKLLRRVQWSVPSGRRVVLVRVSGLRGTSVVSRSLGQAFRAFQTGNPGDFPSETVVERLSA